MTTAPVLKQINQPAKGDPELERLFKEHLSSRVRQVDSLCTRFQFDALIIASGHKKYYFACDTGIPFRTNPYFNYFLPILEQDHYLLLQPGRTPRLYYEQPEDFWHETRVFGQHLGIDVVELEVVASHKEALPKLAALKNIAFIGETLPDELRHAAYNPEPLLHALNWLRAEKTAYEILCTERALAVTAKAHFSARTAFRFKEHEFQIYIDYLSATKSTENELPYPVIAGLNEKSAVLHYEKHRTYPTNGHTLVIDGGTSYLGYSSDITRSYIRKSSDSLALQLFKGMHELQQELIAEVKPGVSFIALHDLSHRKICRLLCDLKVIKDLSVDSAMDLQLSYPFYPHGLGHFLGLNVHDVTGKVLDDKGTPCVQPERYPFLRTLRTLFVGNLLTIEPGIYFIPQLLNKLKQSPHRQHIDWTIIERLKTYGGIRVEDNILVTAEGHRDLSSSVVGKEFLV